MAPVMRPPKGGVSYSEALAAAYASAPEDEIILDTLEFNHPLFIDGDGQPMGIRVVNDHLPLMATLEADAPLNAGELVEFRCTQFNFRRPSESDSGSLPEIELQIDNAARVLMPYLDIVKNSRDPIKLIWRPYLVSDLSGPHINPPLTLTIRTVGGDMNSLTARAGFTDLMNRRFPASEYTSKKFPGLAAR